MPSSPPSLACALTLGLTLLAACGPEAPGSASSSTPGAASESAPREVRTTLVTRASWERSVPALGELAPYERVVVAAKVPGRLAELSADRGDAVLRGALVARLEDREYEFRLRAAEAAVASARALLGLADDGARADPDTNTDTLTDRNTDRAPADDTVEAEDTAGVRLARAELERARLERERASALAREGVDSQALADTAEADFRAAESRLQEAREEVAVRRAVLAQRRAELEIARAQLAETRIEAPFDGRVVARLSATGAYLSTGAPLLELVRLDPLRLVLEVGERDAAQVRAGQLVRARVEGHEPELTGAITRLAPALTRSSRALVLEVELRAPDAALRPGAFAEARIVVAPDEAALTIPSAAVVSFAGLDKVFVVAEGRSVERRVVLGRREPARVEVLSGLAADEEVVLSPGKLGGGQAVRVAR